MTDDIPLRAVASIQNNEMHLLKEWLADGGSLDQREANGETLLHKAAFYGRIEIARFLLEQGLALDAGDKQGFTPLHEAARNGQAAMVQFLLEQGADPQAKTTSGRSALEMALENAKSEPTAQVLRMAQAKPKEEFHGDELVRVTPKPYIHHTLTEIFNFRSGVYLLITKNDNTQAETSVMRTFDELAGTTLLQEAEAAFEKQGGKLPVHYGSVALSKSKLPRPAGG